MTQRLGHRSQHPDECNGDRHQEPAVLGIKDPRPCCWYCSYCRLRIKIRVKPDSHATRCSQRIMARSVNRDPTVCPITEPLKHKDHARGCCRPCPKCGRFITDDLLSDHLVAYCPMNSDDDPPDAA